MSAPAAATLEHELAALRAQVEALKGRLREDRVSIVCFSGEWDRLFAAFVIANGALAMDQEVDLFITFWAAGSLRKGAGNRENKALLDRLLGGMLPNGPERAPLSRMNWFGLGKWFFRRRMKAKGEYAGHGNVDACGVATFLKTATKGSVVLFI